MMRLYLVRHPKPLVEAGICYGVSDLACAASDLQTAVLALRDTLPKACQVISSPLQRCEQLAQVLYGREPDFAYQTDARLAEMDFGAWEMQAWDAISRDELTAWTDDFANYRCGGFGESTGQFVRRVAQRLGQSAQSGEDQVWITHAGVIRALQWLHMQPWAVFTALVQGSDSLCHLRAADWPRGGMAFAQVLTWDWPPAWPLNLLGLRRGWQE